MDTRGETMAKLINLRTVRKSRARAEKRKMGDEAAVKHGRRKSEQRANADSVKRLDQHLDGHKLE